jgi:hypothetical protein
MTRLGNAKQVKYFYFCRIFVKHNFFLSIFKGILNFSISLVL